MMFFVEAPFKANGRHGVPEAGSPPILVAGAPPRPGECGRGERPTVNPHTIEVPAIGRVHWPLHENPWI